MPANNLSVILRRPARATELFQRAACWFAHRARNFSSIRKARCSLPPTLVTLMGSVSGSRHSAGLSSSPIGARVSRTTAPARLRKTRWAGFSVMKTAGQGCRCAGTVTPAGMELPSDWIGLVSAHPNYFFPSSTARHRYQLATVR